MRRFQFLATAAVLLALGVPAEAYYHYVYYPSRTGPFTPIHAKFDTTKLINNTVVFSVTDSGPSTYFTNDSFSSVLAQIKQALSAWNAIPNSNLHVAFGGLEYSSQTAITPGGDVVFQDLGPGLLGMGSPNLATVPQFSTDASGQQFVAITRSTVTLTNNTSLEPGPSYLEMYFTTAVHEFGHALGLQHTWTASAMSQDVIRDTMRSRPLDADDIASFLELYGASGWASNYGSLSGKVLYSNGQPVTLASVVAIPTIGPAVSALTNPDGTYTIKGLPANSYLIYVHPLPPDAIVGYTGLLLPRDASGYQFTNSSPFRTVFYPNTLDPAQATPISLNAGTVMTGLNFNVQQKSSVPAYDLVVYSYPDTASHDYTYSPSANAHQVTPAFLDVTQGNAQFLIQADGTTTTTPIPQSISILGVDTASSCALRYALPCFSAFNTTPGVSPGVIALAGYFNLSSSLGIGPRHMVLNYGSDIYVIPDGVNFVQQGPPFLTSVFGNGDGSVSIVGGNFGPDSRVYFDGLPATTLSSQSGAISVTPPSGTNGQISTVTVFNADGQNSMMFYMQPQNAPSYSYPATAVTQIASVTPSGLPAGNLGTPYSAMVDISTNNGNFVDGQVVVGAGSADMVVNRVWVLSTNHLQVDISVAPGAAVGNTELSVLSGFQLMTAQFQILPTNPAAPLVSGVLSADSYQPTVYRGSYGAVYGNGLQSSGQPTAALNGIAVGIQYASSSQVNFAVPAGFPTGPAVLTLGNGSGTVSLVVPIGDPPPVIQTVASSQGTAVDTNHAANVGDVLSVYVNGINTSSTPALNRIGVTISGLPMNVVSITPAANAQFQIQFVMGQSFGGSLVPLAVSLDGSASNAYTIAAH